jgi:hypothetical protein
VIAVQWLGIVLILFAIVLMNLPSQKEYKSVELS